MANFCSECGQPLQQGAQFCNRCGNAVGSGPAAPQLKTKREKVLNRREPRKKINAKTVVITGFALLFAGWIYFSWPKQGNPIIDAQPVVAVAATYPESGKSMMNIPATVSEGKIRIPLDVVKKNNFVAFSYVTPSRTTPLLAYISGEGKIVTAISLCEPCSSTRFHIKGEQLICNTCGSTWELDNLEAVSGACGKYPPDAIPNVVAGNEVQIDEAIVTRWQRRI